MTDYRIFTLTKESRIAGPARIATFDSDQQAIDQAKQLLGGDAGLDAKYKAFTELAESIKSDISKAGAMRSAPHGKERRTHSGLGPRKNGILTPRAIDC